MVVDARQNRTEADGAGDDEVPLRYDNVVSLSPGVAKLLVQGCMLAFAAIVVWCCTTPTRRSGSTAWPIGCMTNLLR